MNRLRVPLNRRPRKLRGTLGLGSGPEGRIERIRMTVTQLMRHERLEGSFAVLDESRAYAELLIQQAAMHGPKNKEVVEMADFWLLDKDLVHKLFNTLVPRYKNYSTSYTDQYQLPNVYPENRMQAVLELKGNPWPPVNEHAVDTSKWIHNVLLTAARKSMTNKTTDTSLSDIALNTGQTHGTAV